MISRNIASFSRCETWTRPTALLSRVYGKLKATLEVQQTDMDRVAAMSPEERQAAREELAARRDALPGMLAAVSD